VPRKGEWLSFSGELGEKITEWQEEVDDVLVVGYVEHTFLDNHHHIRVECCMDRDLKNFLIL
jgi:hypothetical protein